MVNEMVDETVDEMVDETVDEMVDETVDAGALVFNCPKILKKCHSKITFRMTQRSYDNVFECEEVTFLLT
jgi:tRNA G10  N-methylase Trm11